MPRLVCLIRALNSLPHSQRLKEIVFLLVVATTVIGFKQIYISFTYPASSQSTLRATDCHERWIFGERKPGIYNIYPNGNWYPLQVFCGHTKYSTFTLFQQRVFGNVTFERTWKEYKDGFGAPNGDYWMGLDQLVQLTQKYNQSLRIDMLDWENNYKSIVYSTFSVSPESDCYRLKLGRSVGNVQDSMAHHRDRCFNTKDKPDSNKCAINQGTGWWYHYCSHALLNGVHYRDGKYASIHDYYDGIYWRDWRGLDYSLKFVAMSLTQQIPQMYDHKNFNQTFGDMFQKHLKIAYKLTNK